MLFQRALPKKTALHASRFCWAGGGHRLTDGNVGNPHGVSERAPLHTGNNRALHTANNFNARQKHCHTALRKVFYKDVCNVPGGLFTFSRLILGPNCGTLLDFSSGQHAQLLTRNPMFRSTKKQFQRPHANK